MPVTNPEEFLAGKGLKKRGSLWLLEEEALLAKLNPLVELERKYHAASNKAAETMRAACPADAPTTMVGRMEAMEKRVDAMSQAIKTVRPALEATGAARPVPAVA